MADNDSTSGVASPNEGMDISSIDGSFLNMSALHQSTPKEEVGYTADKCGVYKCHICEYTTNRKYNYHRHVQTHSVDLLPLLCATCGKKFKSDKGLKLHQLQHTGSFKFKCNLCNKGYNVKAAFKLHLKMHIDMKTFKCKTCGIKYAHLKDLHSHIRVIHKGLSYSCSICHLNFGKKDTLRDHIKATHEGRLYTCSICNKPYKYRSSLAYRSK